MQSSQPFTQAMFATLAQKVTHALDGASLLERLLAWLVRAKGLAAIGLALADFIPRL
jgi:hypothetical protein